MKKKLLAQDSTKLQKVLTFVLSRGLHLFLSLPVRLSAESTITYQLLVLGSTDSSSFPGVAPDSPEHVGSSQL